MLTRDIPEMMEGRDVMKMHQECLHPLLLGVDQVREAVEEIDEHNEQAPHDQQ